MGAQKEGKCIAPYKSIARFELWCAAPALRSTDSVPCSLVPVLFCALTAPHIARTQVQALQIVKLCIHALLAQSSGSLGKPQTKDKHYLQLNIDGESLILS